MIRTAASAAIAVYFALAVAVLSECVFLAPLKRYIWQEYGTILMWFSGVFILNLFCAFYMILRRFALEDTGQKLRHLEKQLRSRETISEELSARIKERE